MKITTYTNIFVSSTFWDGDSLKIIEKVERREIDLSTIRLIGIAKTELSY